MPPTRIANLSRCIRLILRSRIALPSVVLAAACGDPTGFDEFTFVSDTLTVATLSDASFGMPTAIDISASGLLWGAARYPERAADAGSWDFLLVQGEDAPALVPARLLGFESNAAISQAIPDEHFHLLARVPADAGLSEDSAVVLRVGRVHVARSRLIECFSSSGYYSGHQYAKLMPIEIEESTGIVRLVVTTNSICGDTRLVP